MREIKFRAWDVLGKRMFYGVGVRENRVMFTPEIYQSTWNVGENFLEATKNFEKYNFIPMQFTGLHDKNGKEIYEGDIIQEVDLNTRIYQVLWDDFRWVLQAKITQRHFKDAFQMEVIGNIYENPELVKT